MSTTLSSSDSSLLEFGLTSSCSKEERLRIGEMYGGDWSDEDDNHDKLSVNHITNILEETFSNNLFSDSTTCFFLKSRMYNDNIQDVLLPAIAIQLKVRHIKLFYNYTYA